jgi:hypothetical protein
LQSRPLKEGLGIKVSFLTGCGPQRDVRSGPWKLCTPSNFLLAENFCNADRFRMVISDQLHCGDGIVSMISDVGFKILNIMIQDVEGEVEEENMLRINRGKKVINKFGSSLSYLN